ncbi:MAG: hypothetical protein ACO1RX_20495 [Candidatus Sericytochromatia bacterium]
MALTACGPEGLGSGTPAGQAPAFQRLDPSLDYPAGGHGFDADDNLLLIGKEETIRWLRSEKRFARYGGPLPNVENGTIQRDGAGNLYLSANGTLFFTLPKGGTAWEPLTLSLPEFAPESGRSYRNGPVGLHIGQDGRQVVLAEYLDNQGSGYVIYERSAGEAAFRQRFEFAKDSAPLKFIGDIQRAIQLRADGTLYLHAGNTHFVLPPGAVEPTPLLDCSTLVGSYCNGEYALVSHPASNTAYVVNAGFGPLKVFRLPAATAYPVTPQEVQAFPGAMTEVGQSRFQLDSQGRLWGALDVADALTVDYPPYLLDVTTLRRLEGDKWKDITRFQTPGFEWVISEHNTLYSFGRQLVSGGFWKGWGVYSLSF